MNLLKKSTVLVVDDDEFTLNLIVQFLVGEGCVVYKADSGRQAIQWLECHRPDVLLTGVYMPGMNGLELARWFTNVYPDTPFLFMSGGATGKDIAEGYELGACKFLPKPFSREELFNSLTSALNAARTHTLRQFSLPLDDD